MKRRRIIPPRLGRGCERERRAGGALGWIRGSGLGAGIEEVLMMEGVGGCRGLWG